MLSLGKVAMDWYLEKPVWMNEDDCPHTCVTAKPVSYESVRNKTVIKVEGARYRRATFSGLFVLAEPETIKLVKSGKERVEVFVRWFGHRLKTRGPKILVDLSKAEVIKGYSGKVVSNIAR